VKQLADHAGVALFEQLGQEDLSHARRRGPGALQPGHHRPVSRDEDAMASHKGISGGKLKVAVISAGTISSRQQLGRSSPPQNQGVRWT